jgi:hypothetical protein
MNNFLTIAEIVKKTEFNYNWIVYSPFVWYWKMSTGDLSSSFFTSIYEASDVTNKTFRYVQSVTVNTETEYSQQFSLSDCQSNEESFYVGENQKLYVHFNHSINPNTALVELGITYGYNNKKVKRYNNIDYLPLLKSVPNLKNATDPLQYKKMSFYGGNVLLNNKTHRKGQGGEFDERLDLYGSDINILFGDDEDSYSDLKQINKNYIANYNLKLTDVNFDTKDKREKDSKEVPFNTFNTTDYPDINTDLVDQIIPELYGSARGIPGICINEDSAGLKEFKFASVITGTPTVYAKKDNKWTTVTPNSINNSDGTVTLENADAHVDGDTSNGLNDVKADLTGVDLHNPGDIIKDLNDTFLNITYNSSNYDTTEWEDEKQYLADVYLYMDKKRDLNKWIEELQNGSTVGFKYEINYGKRTLRLDNPNRDYIDRIEAIEILNNDKLPVDLNAEFYSTDCIVEYNKDHTDDFYKKFENDDFFDEVFEEYRVAKTFTAKTLLISESDAEDKADIIMDDQKVTRPIFEIIVHGKKYFDLRVYDIVNAEISFPGIRVGFETVDTITFTDESSDDLITFTDNENDDLLTFVDYSKQDIYKGRREFYGWQRCQVIGIAYDFTNGNVTLTLRQREFSDIFESVTGYNP